MEIRGYLFPVMLRRSPRLQQRGYYTEEGTPSISYKEILYRIFRRKTGHRNVNHHANYVAEKIQHNQDVMRNSETWTPNNPIHVTSMSETQTRRNTGCNFSAKNVSSFLLVLLLVFGITHMHFQLMELQQEVQSLRQEMDKFLPLADTIANYALESQGARVLQHLSSDTYWPQKHIGLLWDTICSWWYSAERQRRVIQGHSSLHPGQCWCFSGNHGHLFISLSHPVYITHVTLGHITKSQSPNGYITSAPRKFSVYGMSTTNGEKTCLGTLVYNQDSAAFQTFKLSNQDDCVFRYVKLQIESNWGNINNTCLYSFRVHGKLPTYQHSYSPWRKIHSR